MKLISLAPLLLPALFFAGCATEPEPLLDEAGEKLERGFTGRGALYEQEHEDDPFIRDEAQ